MDKTCSKMIRQDGTDGFHIHYDGQEGRDKRRQKADKETERQTDKTDNGRTVMTMSIGLSVTCRSASMDKARNLTEIIQKGVKL